MLDEPNGAAVAETEAPQGLVLNGMVGRVGALPAGLRRAPLFGLGPSHRHDCRLASRGCSRLGALSLPAVVNPARRGTGR
jgi:hypothetical protein